MDWNIFKKRPKIGLALGGGGPKGLAHLGVINMLERHNIPIDYIAGTSAGSIAGAFYAAKKNTLDIEKYILSKNWWDMLKLFIDPSFKEGVLQGKRVEEFLKGYLGEHLTFNQLKIPFQTVCVNLQSGKTVGIQEGSVVRAIMASCAAPLLFKPVEINNEYYVDGGITSQVPVDIVRKMGADIVIAVNLTHYTTFAHINEQMNLMEVSRHAINIMLTTIAAYQTQRADVVVKPELDFMHWRSLLSHEDEIKAIQKGETAMEKKLLELDKVIISKTPILPTIIKKIKHFLS